MTGVSGTLIQDETMAQELTREFDRLVNVDLDAEWCGGSTNIKGAVGNGRLTAGISFWGEG
ncbi:TPA: hypothetical protein EYP38_00365, partial [Candidatus Micrarchaeota archaeon]|nr:hypothetical protein [Candidatus Micrarchaeota archaeon]